MKRDKIIYWVSTGLLSLHMLFSAGMYIFNHEQVSEIFTNLGFPTFIIYPLAFAKLLGILVIITRRNRALVEWAYAGFFFNFLLALSAHLNVSDGQFASALVALVFLFLSYTYQKKIFATEAVEN